MKQFFMLCLLISISYTSCHALPLYKRAVQEISTRSSLQKDRAAVLTDAQYRKEKRRNRAIRHQEKAAQRKANYEQKKRTLQSMHNYIAANRTSADHAQRAKNLFHQTARRTADEKAIQAQKNKYLEEQKALTQQKINVHTAARNALRNAL